MKALRPLLVMLLVATTRVGRADTPAFSDADHLVAPRDAAWPPVALPTLDAFSYSRKEEKHYFRAIFEVGAIFAIGNVDYLLNTGARGGTVRQGDTRWDLRYDWQTFRSKLKGVYWKVDTNHFNTNYVSHPFASTLYYSAARANQLSVFESVAYTAVGSLFWEMFGELREAVSVNDMVVTSFSGLTIGEPLIQLSSFFYRSKKSVRNDVLAAAFSPLKALNDWADGAEHARATDVDARGLTRTEWHRFEIFGGAGVTRQRGGTYADQRFGLDFAIVNIPDYRGPARRHAVFDDGNVSAVHFETTLSGGQLADASFVTRLVPVGVHTRNARKDESGAVRGEGGLVGLLTSFEYTVHDYARDGSRPLDVIAAVSPIGAVVEYEYDSGSLRARTRLELSGSFAGVSAFALRDYRTRHGGNDAHLQTVLAQQGYYHALGGAASPSVELGAGPLELGGRLTLGTWHGIEGLDERQSELGSSASLSEQRGDLRAWVALEVPRTPLRIEVLGRARIRAGAVGDARARADETSLYGNLGCVF